MDLGAFLLLFLVLLFVVTFVFWPLLKRWHIQQSETAQELSTLLAERDRVLKEIQELDFDNSLGKIPPDEYPVQRKALLQMGTEVLRRIDSLKPTPTAPAGEDGKLTVGQVKKELSPGVDLATDEDIEVLIAARRAIRKEKTGGFCPKCGKPFLQSDQFCSCCGQPLGVRP